MITNDLRPYAAIKFGPVLLLVPFLRSSCDRAHLRAIVLLFGLAQVPELGDHAIYSLVAVSGHTIKHLIAGLATYCMLRWRLEYSSERHPSGDSLRQMNHAPAIQ